MILCGDPAVVVNADPDVASTLLKENISYMMVSPNPNQGAFTLESKIDGVLEIINASGSLVYHDIISTGANRIRVQLPTGMYVLKLVGASRQDRLKILIY